MSKCLIKRDRVGVYLRGAVVVVVKGWVTVEGCALFLKEGGEHSVRCGLPGLEV